MSISDPHLLRLRKAYSDEAEEHGDVAHGFTIYHDNHGHVGSLHAVSHGDSLNVTHMHLDGAYESGDNSAVGALGPAGVRQLGRELRRHGFKTVWSDSRATGTRGKYAASHLVPDIKLKEGVADALITQQLREVAAGEARPALEHPWISAAKKMFGTTRDYRQHGVKR